MAFPLYVDEDSMHRATMDALRARGVDVLAVRAAARCTVTAHPGYPP